MALEPIAVVSLETLNALSLNDGSRDRIILEARVTAMLSNTMARLNIAGQTIDVPTSKPLPVGTILTLRPSWKDGQLQLVVQDPPRIAAAPEFPAPRGQSSRSLAEPIKTALGLIQAMTVEGMLSGATQPDELTAARPGATIPPRSPSTLLGQEASEGTAQRPAPAQATVEGLLSGAAHRGELATAKPDGTIPSQSPSDLPGQETPESIAQRPTPGQASALAGQPSAAPTGSTAANPATAASADAGQPSPPSIGERSQTPLQGPAGGIQDLRARVASAAADQLFPLADRAKVVPQPPMPSHTATAEPHAPRPQGAAVASPEGQQQAGPAEKSAASAQEKLAPAAGYGTSDTTAEPPRAERLTTIAVEVPIFLAGANVPLRLQITRNDEPAAQERDEKRSSSWVVRFSSDTGRLGMIHAAISLVDGHIGVQLWAERGDTADWFRQETRQLRDALQASDLQLDAVRVSHGSPLADLERAV
jgi:hypothetical protein